jgi:hypothetical protein
MGTLPQFVPHSTLPALTRTFGVDLEPPRQLYFAFIPAILALTGIVSWAMGDEAGMVLSMVVATAVSLFSLWDWIFNHAATRFSTLLGMTLLFGYGAGALNTWITLPRGSLSLATAMGSDEGVLTRGLAAVLMSSACLYFLGEIFERPIFGRDFRFQIDARTRFLIYAGTMAILIGYATHQMGIGGAAGGGGHVSVPGAFLSWLYPPLTSIAVVSFLTARRTIDRVLGGLAAFALLLVFSVMGRRITIYTSLEVLLVMGLAGFRWREKSVRNVLVILALAAVMIATSLTFMLLRIAGATVTRGTVTVGRRFEIAHKMVQKGGAGAFEQAGEATQTNFQTRTFVLTFLATILDASAHQTPALGQDALALAEQAIPSVLDPYKKTSFSEEGLVNQQFQLSFPDQPNSVLTAGATDFGLLGMILYPLLLVLALRVLLAIAARWLKPVPLMIATLYFIYLMLETEITLTGYFEALRDTVLFGTLVAIFLALPRIRLRAS